METSKKETIYYSLDSEHDQLVFNFAFGFLLISIICLFWLHNFTSIVIAAVAFSVFYYNYTHDGEIEFYESNGEIYFSDLKNPERTALKVIDKYFTWNYGEPIDFETSTNADIEIIASRPILGIDLKLKLVLENDETYLLKLELNPWIDDVPHWNYNPNKQLVNTTYEVTDLKNIKKLFF